MASTRVDRWAVGKDLAEMLSTLRDFADEFGVFNTEHEPDRLAQLLRRRPAAMRRAFESACHELDAERHERAPPSVQAIAQFLEQKLSRAHNEWLEEGGDEDQDENESDNCLIS
jgi:hypothetical protein